MACMRCSRLPGFEHAGGSQEEAIFRSTSIFLSLWPHRRKAPSGENNSAWGGGCAHTAWGGRRARGAAAGHLDRGLRRGAAPQGGTSRGKKWAILVNGGGVGRRSPSTSTRSAVQYTRRTRLGNRMGPFRGGRSQKGSWWRR